MHSVTSNAVSKAMSYSTEEHWTGKYWIDGKKIYSKTVDCGVMPNTAYKNVNHSISNMDFLIKVEGVCFSSSVTPPRFLPLPNVPTQDLANRIGINATRTQIEIYAAKDRTNYTVSYVTLEYTKTTG